MVQKIKAGTPRFEEGVAVPSQVGKSKEDWIGNQFRRIYDEALEDSIPSDMLSLLEQLDEQTSASGAQATDGEQSGEESSN